MAAGGSVGMGTSETAGGANGVIGAGSVGEGKLKSGPEWEKRKRERQAE